MRTTTSPHTAAITNITPNHLDQFGWDDYQALKYRIVAYQSDTDRVVLPFDEPLAARAATMTPAQPSWFGLGGGDGRSSVWSDGVRILRNGEPLVNADALQIPGEHNLRNALAALAIVGDLVPDEVATHALSTFAGVPHRLELVAEVAGVRFRNDSIATTPERTLAGLKAIDGSIVLMLGGRDKQLPLDPLLDEMRRHVRKVVLFGESGSEWQRWLTEQDINAVYESDFESALLPRGPDRQSGRNRADVSRRYVVRRLSQLRSARPALPRSGQRMERTEGRRQ